MKETVFDQRLYDQLEDGVFDAHYNLNQALDQLKAEGFNTDLETIELITKEEDSFKNHIIKLQRERLSGGFVPVTEKEMVIDAFSQLHDRLANKIKSLRNSLQSSLILKKEGDSVVADDVAMEKRLKEKATLKIDVKKAQAYYEKIIKLVDAYKELTAHEKKNGYAKLVTLTFNNLYPFSFPLERDGTITEDTFLYAFRNRFKK